MTIPAGTAVPREARELGSYELIAKLATGGMAEIFLARRVGENDNSDDDLVVVKRILPHLAEDDHFVTMFRDEAALASRLEHPNVCRVHTLSHVASTWFMVMEYLHGIPLSRILTHLAKSRQFLDFRLVASLICQACEGLHHAHELRDDNGHLLGLVHRDVSPPNIFVTADGTVKVLDFGIAKARGASSKTRTGTVKGKNAYMSPEQILGKTLDRRSDIFALGAVAYELIAVRRLFHRDSDFLTFKAITEEPITDIRERRPDIPAGLRSMVTRALARDPSGRFATALEFAESMRHAVAHLGGPMSREEVGRYISTTFADDLSVKDRLLKDNDGVPLTADGSSVPMLSASGGVAVALLGRRGRTGSSTEEIDYVDGELDVDEDDATRQLRVPTSERTPTMIVASTPTGKATRTNGGNGTGVQKAIGGSGAQKAIGGSGAQKAIDGSGAQKAIDGVRKTPPPIPMPSKVAASTVEVGEIPTDLLGDYRRKRLRTLALGGSVIALALALVVVISASGPGVGAVKEPLAAPTPDAVLPDAAVDEVLDLDAGPSRENIVALSQYGFLSIDANAKTRIFIDGKLVGEAPLTRYPVKPGIRKIKAIGPRNKVKRFDVTIYAVKDTDYGRLEW